jgi:signal transduction histidine kinase
MTIRAKLFAGFIILILIFAASFFVNQRLSDQVTRNSRYLNNSEAIIRNSNIFHKLIIDMQSGYRGYLLTGQDAFLETYNDALNRIPAISREQRNLVSSDIQKSRLDSIMHLHQMWVEYANALIAVRNDTLPEGTRLFKELFEKKVKSYVGKKMNDRIREIFTDFDNHEYKVRRERMLALQSSIVDTRNINLGLTVFFIILSLASSWYIIRIITRRISKMVVLAEKIAEGDFRRVDDREHDELRRLTESLNRMSETLERNFMELTRKNKDLDDFAYVVSHDLKAPLRGIDNIVTWMDEDHGSELTPEIRKSIELIRGRAKRLENMINGLLAYARIGKAKKDLESVDLNVMLRELTEILVPPGTETTWEEMPTVVTDKLQLEQVFSNLISNAVKHNDKAKAKVHISVIDKGPFYEFSVEDNGIGIQEEYFEKIFQIFQTLRERDAFESTGVGLAIVKRIVEEQGGTIRVKSEPGKGTTFTFTWHKN